MNVDSFPGSISSLLYAQCSEKPALLAQNRSALTYAGLCDQVERTVTAINNLGIGRNDKVAIILPNGPELASAFLGIAAGASVAPLNPALNEEDFRFYLSDLGAAALFVKRDSKSLATIVAKSLRIPVLELAWREEDPAGTFFIAGDPIGPRKDDGPTCEDDIALVLHTSGTTSRPKMVPLSQRNLVASARQIVDTLRLTPQDRSLNVMPLFHIHGLIAGVMSSLASGGSVFCAPGFNGQSFFQWLVDATPTWYSAVPTIHQAVLAHAERTRDNLDKVHLRFIRSSSSALPPSVMRKLEETFNAPVIESYGMTEAAHQMASNPLPPGERRPGTVGLAAGPEIAIMAENHNICPAGKAGEVVIRGPNVFAGYENNPEETAVAFTDGWFHTGDQGVLDERGYLTIIGRIKEIINRGGQKISPREIDDALMDHPDVAAGAAFPIPHPTLGEEIVVALVAKQGRMPTERELIEFLRSRLAAFKIPRRIFFVEEIPKGPTGKIRRNELAEMLGLSRVVDTTRASKSTDKRTPTLLEAKLLRVWEQVLGLNNTVGLDENFFLLGGDSLQAVELVAQVEKALGRSLPPSVLIEFSTVAEMATHIEKDAVSACLIPIQSQGSRPPLFCVHDRSGRVLFLRRLAQHMHQDQPIYGLRSAGLDGKETPLATIEAMAAHYIQEIRKVQPMGPYYLCGYSLGGIVAYEMTRQFSSSGEKVALLALIDTLFVRPTTFARRLRRACLQLYQMRYAEIGNFLIQKLHNATEYAAENMRRSLLKARTLLFSLGRVEALKSLYPNIDEINVLAARTYRQQPLLTDAVFIVGAMESWQNQDMRDGWKEFILGNLEIRQLSGLHRELMNEPYVSTLAAELTDCLERRLAQPSANVSR